MLGVFITCLASILPSFLTILLVAAFFTQIKDNKNVKLVFKGIRPVVAGMVFASAFNLSKNIKFTFKNFYIPILVAIAVWYYKVTPILIIVIAMIFGILLKGSSHK